MIKNKGKSAEIFLGYFDKPNNWDSSLHSAIKIGEDLFFIDTVILSFCLDRTFYVSEKKYLKFKIGYRRSKSFHSFINKTADGYVCDHINRNKKDNRSLNLRTVHSSLNNHNKDSDGKRGVRFRKGKYCAEITFNKKTTYLGRFLDIDEARVAYDHAAVKFYGVDAKTNFQLSNYSIPENPLINTLKPNAFVRVRELVPCKWIYCKKHATSYSEFCYRHTRVVEERKNKKASGKRLRVVGYPKQEFCINCNDKKTVFARGLCVFHYRKQREKEGYKKNKKRYVCEYEIQDGSPCGRVAIKIKERLCSTHYKEKYGLFKKRGAPSGEIAPCKICGEDGSFKTGFCKKHYLEDWNKRKKNERL